MRKPFNLHPFIPSSVAENFVIEEISYFLSNSEMNFVATKSEVLFKCLLVTPYPWFMHSNFGFETILIIKEYSFYDNCF